jgi:uncharacterized membrane protein HdeD (DUF308 family)
VFVKLTERGESAWRRVYRASVIAMGGVVILVGANALVSPVAQSGTGSLDIAAVVTGIGMVLVGVFPRFWKPSAQVQ